MNGLLQDFRFGLRMLVRSPGFTAAAVLSLALGIGANTAIFSLMDAVMLRSLPVEEPQRLVILGPGEAQGISSSDTPIVSLFSYPRYLQLAAGNDGLADLAAVGSMNWTAYLEQEAASPEGVSVGLVSGNYFRTVGVRAGQGRLIEASDVSEPGADPIAVLSFAFWQGTFGGRTDIVGQDITLNGLGYTVIGVAPASFRGERVGARSDLWVPLTMQQQISRMDSLLDDPQVCHFNLIGRLRPGVSIDQAEASLAVLWERILRAEPRDVPDDVFERAMAQAQMTLRAGGRGYNDLDELQSPLTLLLGVTGLVLLIACANVANLLIARASGRRKEIGVRLALGAGRFRLIRQLLTESLVLSLAGGLLGLAFASWARDLLVSMLARGADGWPLDISIQGRTLAFTFSVATLTGVLFGLVPALRAGRANLTSALKTGGRGVAEGSRSGIQRGLVASQAALAVVLLAGSGLFLKSLDALRSSDMGFDVERLLTFEVDTRGAGYAREELEPLYAELMTSIRAVPGVEQVAWALFPPITGARRSASVAVEGYEESPDEDMDANVVHVTPSYFDTLGMRFLEGRPLDERDRSGAPRVVVVDPVLARRFFGEDSAVGGRIRLEGEWYEVVGVAEQAKYYGFHEPERPLMYTSVYQEMDFLRGIVVRANGEPGSLTSGVRRAIEAGAPQLPIRHVETMAARLDRDVRVERLLSHLTIAFGALATLLAGVGLYGVVAYAVGRRTNEFGVRKALGAQAGQVLRLVLRESLTLIAAGGVVGLAAAVALGPLVANLLHGVSPRDVASLSIAALLIGVAGLVAGLPPALRAARLSPQEALRYE